MENVSLRVLLLYADRRSAELGKEVTEALSQRLGSAFHVRQSTWNCELLRSAKLRDLAAVEARESDMVIVAMDEGLPLWPEIQEWFDLWRERAAGKPAALVALLKRDEIDTPHTVEESLHAFANEAKMDFFCHSELRHGYPRFRINAPDAALFAAAH